MVDSLKFLIIAGIVLYHGVSSPLGKVYFTLADIPTHRLFSTESGNLSSQLSKGIAIERIDSDLFRIRKATQDDIAKEKSEEEKEIKETKDDDPLNSTNSNQSELTLSMEMLQKLASIGADIIQKEREAQRKIEKEYFKSCIIADKWEVSLAFYSFNCEGSSKRSSKGSSEDGI